MTISGASSSLDSLAALASGLKSASVGQQIGVAVLKQIQDSQQAQAQQLLQMMQQTAAVARGGVDMYA